MKKVFVFTALTIAGLAFYGCPPETEEELKLVWSDEFNYSGIPDPSKWSYDVGDGCNLPCGCGWGNLESQYYTEQDTNNAYVSNGHLVIQAKKQKIGNTKYTSARLVTKGKGEWKYGRIEIRANLPAGRGLWPAIWMLSTEDKYKGWPHSGEIDIMEHVGYNADTVVGTVHTLAYNGMIGTQKSGYILDEDCEGEFRTYRIDWTPDRIKWYIEDRHYFTFENDGNGFEGWPFDQKFYLIMNLAVGGRWGGKFGIDNKIFPQKLMVDYVRVYQ